MSAHIGVPRRRVSAWLAAVAALPFLPGRIEAAEEIYPNRLIRIIVPWPAGAITDQQGLIRSAAGGTLFLDEIGDLPLDIQPKLLRFLEQAEIMPVGETRAWPSVRIVTTAGAASLTTSAYESRPPATTAVDRASVEATRAGSAVAAAGPDSAARPRQAAPVSSVAPARTARLVRRVCGFICVDRLSFMFVPPMETGAAVDRRPNFSRESPGDPLPCHN